MVYPRILFYCSQMNRSHLTTLSLPNGQIGSILLYMPYLGAFGYRES